MPTDTVVSRPNRQRDQGPRHRGAERHGPFGLRCDSPAHDARRGGAEAALRRARAEPFYFATRKAMKELDEGKGERFDSAVGVVRGSGFVSADAMFVRCNSSAT